MKKNTKKQLKIPMKQLLEEHYTLKMIQEMFGFEFVNKKTEEMDILGIEEHINSLMESERSANIQLENIRAAIKIISGVGAQLEYMED
jgi:hypothetical protein